MKAKKDHDEAMKKEIEKYRLEVEERKAREIQKQKEYGHWEMMQRFKKSEFDKNVELENKKKDLEQKMKYAKELDEIVAEKKANQEREKLFDEESEILQKTIVNENKRILEYAEEVLEESKGIRPLYPILKEIKKCKKEMGILIA
ncbi:DNA ligase 1-like [Prorops nasuta]|uniref:DNA ligase 1-like n=1 Tax=Prorops nasuta TaxID=863751 RepID=UPI0034CF11B7